MYLLSPTSAPESRVDHFYNESFGAFTSRLLHGGSASRAKRAGSTFLQDVLIRSHALNGLFVF